MNNATLGRHDYYQIARAAIIAPLMLLPATVIGVFAAYVYGMFYVDYYDRFSRIFPAGETALITMIIGIAIAVTLVYGAPVYLLFKRFNIANIFTLSAAGYIVLIPFGVYFSLAGAFVAACFWLIITPFSLKITKYIRLGAMLLVLVATVVFIIAKLGEIYFPEDILQYRLGKIIDRNAPLPAWWQSVVGDERIETIADARRIHESLSASVKSGEQLQLANRRFFKASYNALRSNRLSSGDIMELVTLMGVHDVNYPQLFELQKYALSIYPTELTTRLQLLQRMLASYHVGSSEYAYAKSLTYDLITESSQVADAGLLAHVCQQLAAEYDGGKANDFEVGVFTKCLARMHAQADNPGFDQAEIMISKQLDWMKRALKSQADTAADSR